jgi:hypothetical protein
MQTSNESSVSGRVDRKLQLHLQLGVLAHELRDQRRHMAAPEAQRRVHTQQSLGHGLGNPQQLFHAVDLAQDAPRVLQVQLALGREAHAPRRTVHQGHAQARLHQRQVLAHGRRGDAHFARGGAQAAGAGQRREEAQVRRLDSLAHAPPIVEFRLTMD